MASDLGTLGYCIPKLTGSRAHQSASPVPHCFAQKQAAGIVADSSALRDGSRLDSNRGQCGEKRRRKEGKKEVGRKERRQRGEEEERMVADVGSEEPREDGSLDAPLRVGEGRKEAASASRRMSQHTWVRMGSAYPYGSDSYFCSRLCGSRYLEFGPLFKGRKLSCSRGVDSLGC